MAPRSRAPERNVQERVRPPGEAAPAEGCHDPGRCRPGDLPWCSPYGSDPLFRGELRGLASRPTGMTGLVGGTLGPVTLTLLDWRRPVAGWLAWRAGRDALSGTHPDSPVDVGTRASFTGVPVAPYDPALRFVVPVATDVEPERREVPTAADGVVVLDRIGRVTLGDVGRLDVWWVGGYGGGRYLLDTIKGADLGGAGGRLVV